MGQILVVHDEEKRQTEIRSALRGLHRVTLAENVTQAIEILKSREALALQTQPFDLIICCVHMNSQVDNLTVFDLLKWCKGNPHVENVPFVLLCSQPSRQAQYVSDSVQLASQALGGAGYLKFESFESSKFLKMVQSYMTQRNTVGSIPKEFASAYVDLEESRDGETEISIGVDSAESADGNWQI